LNLVFVSKILLLLNFWVEDLHLFNLRGHSFNHQISLTLYT
jgi:hypothetical protein